MKRRSLLKRGVLLVPIGFGMRDDEEECADKTVGPQRKATITLTVKKSVPEGEEVIEPEDYNLRELRPFDELLPKVPDLGPSESVSARVKGCDLVEVWKQTGYSGVGIFYAFLNVDGTIVKVNKVAQL